MKNLISILIIFLPVLTIAQDLNMPSVALKTLDEKYIKPPELFKDCQSAIVYFFNDNSPNVIGDLEYLETLNGTLDCDHNATIIAVYNPTNGNYGNIRAFLHGNSIDLETYIDVNGEFQRALGLADNSTILLSGFNLQTSERYAGSLASTDELMSLVEKYSSEKAIHGKYESAAGEANGFTAK